MKRLPSDFLSVGRGAEYVFRGEDTITLVSGGQILTLTSRLTKEASSLVISSHHGGHQKESVIFEGSATATMQAFLDISSKIAKRPRRSVLATVQSLSISAAAIAIVAALSLFIVETRQSSPMANGLDQPAISLDELDRPIPGLGAMDQTSQAQEPSIETPSLKVLKKPDFLTSDASAEKSGANEQASLLDRKPTIAETVAAIGFPIGAGRTEHAPVTVSAEKAPGSETALETQKAEKPAELIAAPVADGKTETNVGKTSSEQPEAEKDDPTLNKNAQAAVSKLIGDGMTEEQIRKLLIDLKSLEAGSQDGITPEMLRALPEEVAALLADQGMDLKGPTGGTMNILPSEVVDQFRGKDGVASIPENHSWYARSGGPVTIPLPGGGDIKQPDDLKDFGLQP